MIYANNCPLRGDSDNCKNREKLPSGSELQPLGTQVWSFHSRGLLLPPSLPSLQYCHLGWHRAHLLLGSFESLWWHWTTLEMSNQTLLTSTDSKKRGDLKIRWKEGSWGSLVSYEQQEGSKYCVFKPTITLEGIGIIIAVHDARKCPRSLS